MKTNLPEKISTVEQAQALLKELHSNNEAFHPEDNARDIAWVCTPPTDEECIKLNDLMEDIYNLEGNDGLASEMDFDPCLYLIALDKADVAISIDGDPTTIGEYMAVNDWDSIRENLNGILDLQDLDDEFPIPVHCGFVTVRLIASPLYCIRRHVENCTLNDYEYVLDENNNTSTFATPEEAITYLNSLTDVPLPTRLEWEEAGIYIVNYNSLTYANVR